jgi:hypothetical protein
MILGHSQNHLAVAGGRRAAIDGAYGVPTRYREVVLTVSKEDLSLLSLTEPVTKAVWRNNVEHLPEGVTVVLVTEIRDFLVQTIGLEFRQQRLNVRHVKGATILSGIAIVFSKSHLNLVTSKNSCFVRRVTFRDYPEPKQVLIKR